jgi:hypothetical protein
MVAPSQFRVRNSPNSTAVFAEIVVSGYLTREPKG